MLKIRPEIVGEVDAAKSLSDLHKPLQNAIQLEHSTLPPYLTAMFSLDTGKNKEIREIIHSVVVEEMLHMTIACNILNAFDGSPAINTPEFVPKYPGPLPLHIGGNLIVGLAAYSKDVVHDTFMAIEEPEHPLDFPLIAEATMLEATPEFKTIGEFYDHLIKKINELGIDKLPGNPAKQVTSSAFDESDLFEIHTSDDAIRAINVIVEQGEGTSKSPLDQDCRYAHYYRFSELYMGRRLRRDRSVKQGFSFTGDVIPFNKNGVQPLFPNTKAEDILAGTEARRQADQFNFSYGKLLNGLHRTFNGEPGYLTNTIGLMFDLTLIGERLCSMPFPNKSGFHCGTPFQYVNVNQ